MGYSAKVLGEALSRELLFMRSDNRPMAEVTNRLIQVYTDHEEVAVILKARIAALEADNSKLRTAIDELVDNAKAQSKTSLVVLEISKAMNARIKELEVNNSKLRAAAKWMHRALTFVSGKHPATQINIVKAVVNDAIAAYDAAIGEDGG